MQFVFFYYVSTEISLVALKRLETVQKPLNMMEVFFDLPTKYILYYRFNADYARGVSNTIIIEVQFNYLFIMTTMEYILFDHFYKFLQPRVLVHGWVLNLIENDPMITLSFLITEFANLSATISDSLSKWYLFS